MFFELEPHHSHAGKISKLVANHYKHNPLCLAKALNDPVWRERHPISRDQKAKNTQAVGLK